MKEKDNTPFYILAILLIFAITLGMLIINTIANNRTINEIRAELENVPKKHCDIIEKSEKIELKVLYNPLGILYPQSLCKYYEGEVICEDGVAIYAGIKKVCNYDYELSGTAKFCIEKTKEEVCEIR